MKRDHPGAGLNETMSAVQSELAFHGQLAEFVVAASLAKAHLSGVSSDYPLAPGVVVSGAEAPLQR
jgi:hypothetical protein